MRILRFDHVSYSLKESGGKATVTIARGNGTVGKVSVDYATAGGSATPDVDYTPVAGTLKFAQGEYLKTFTIPVLPDGIDEGNETVQLRISNPTGGALVLKGEDKSELKIED